MRTAADAEAALAAYQAGLSLYQADFLQAFPYETWCHEERERLRALYLQAAEEVARRQLRQDDDVEDSLATLEREGCTVLLGVPTIYRMWLNSPRFAQTDFI